MPPSGAGRRPPPLAHPNQVPMSCQRHRGSGPPHAAANAPARHLQQRPAAKAGGNKGRAVHAKAKQQGGALERPRRQGQRQ